MKSCKKTWREREREYSNRRCCIPSLATTDSRLLLVEVEPAVSWPSVAPLISVTVFGTTWGYFYSRLPAFPSLPFSFSRVGRYYLPTYPPKVVLSCNRSNGSDLVCRINFSKSHKRRRNKNTFSFKKRKINKNLWVWWKCFLSPELSFLDFILFFPSQPELEFWGGRAFYFFYFFSRLVVIIGACRKGQGGDGWLVTNCHILWSAPHFYL